MFKIPSIPPITDPFGKYWDQPCLDEIELSLSHAHMSKHAFDILHNYQHSYPTGTYDGKMWKVRNNRGIWYLAWYGPHQDKTKISINYLRIQIH